MALSERRHSDSGALKLLGELKEQSRIAEELRETAAREEKNDVELVVEQLEKDRLVASRRARRLHEELKATQQVGGEGRLPSRWEKGRSPSRWVGRVGHPAGGRGEGRPPSRWEGRVSHQQVGGKGGHPAGGWGE